ncbi:MAG: site-2 protease family protein [Clostridia bacterium]|nr:site-2 protease family protein [Clostridia bacterium]
MIVVYILIAILSFGFLIFIHELGHFIFAKKFGVAITEFSLGMGPKLFSKKGKDGVDYSVRLLPIGGYVAMEGEDSESDNPNSFDKKPAWQRFIIVLAGAVMNILVAVVIITALISTHEAYGSTTVSKFADGATSSTSGLCLYDEIIKVNGSRVHTASELSYEIMRNGYKSVELTVLRNGERVVLKDVVFPQTVSDGIVFGAPDFSVLPEEKNFFTVVKNSFYTCKSTVKMIWESLFDLISGRYGVEHVSGPIGVTGAITTAAKTSAYSLFYLIAVIAMNLGVFNLLPIPALDGASLLLLLVEMITKKKLPERIEGAIKAAGFALLMLLAIIVSFKDIIYLFK